MKILMKPTATGAEYPLAGYTRDVSGIAHRIHAGLFLDTFSTSRTTGYNNAKTMYGLADTLPTTDAYNDIVGNTTEFHVLFAEHDYSTSSWFLDTSQVPMLINTTSNAQTPPFSGAFSSNLFIGYARYGAKYGLNPIYTHNVETVGVNKFSTVGVTFPQANITRLNNGIIKYAYFISYKEVAGQAIARLDVTDVAGTSTHSANYEIVVDDVNVGSTSTPRIKSFNAKVKYQVKNI